MSAKCTAKTKNRKNCKNWAMHGTEPPTCAAHRGILGARPGNQNAVKHAFYRPALTAAEVAALINHAENMTLDDELAISRITLLRLMLYLKSPDLPPHEIAAIAPLIFTGSNTVARLLREIQENGRTSTIWDEALDQLARDLEIRL